MLCSSPRSHSLCSLANETNFASLAELVRYQSLEFWSFVCGFVDWFVGGGVRRGGVWRSWEDLRSWEVVWSGEEWDLGEGRLGGGRGRGGRGGGEGRKEEVLYV
ncbi:hypothetical protein KC19_2G175800 [Ceratodon purpureus]|uniref:Uncharacterized protein n=1 Tax=Ceratodon purpureus TaxID=3225 RepID=A0A8T0IWW5_CERPU|nr:hypothetical protein KC19_2G175800 [Ceratodon purpureus]